MTVRQHIDVLAVESSGGADPISQLYQYGAVGVLAAVFLLLSYRLLKNFEATLEVERKRGDNAVSDLAKLNADMRDKVIPTLERNMAMMAQILQTQQRGEQHERPRR